MPSARDELEGRLYAAILKNPRNGNVPMESVTRGLVDLTNNDKRSAAANVVRSLERRTITAKIKSKSTLFQVTIFN